MSASLSPEINDLNPNSLCYAIYQQLYNRFFNAQDNNIITEGDEISIRLHNTAYNFADAIASAVEGGSGPSEGILTSYLKKTGGDMYGLLKANYGFEAGINNYHVIQVFSNQEKGIGVEIDGSLYVGGNALYIGNKQIIQYDSVTNTTILESNIVNFHNSKIQVNNQILLGTDNEHGLLITPNDLQIKGKSVYHEGNANRPDITWNMADANIFGDLHVTGTSIFSGSLQALQDVYFGSRGKKILSISGNNASLEGFLTFQNGYGIKINNDIILGRINNTDIILGTSGGDIYLGSGNTFKIRLQKGLTDINGNILITEYGQGYFPGSLVVKHNRGEELLSSYRTSDEDEGIVIHKKLRFMNDKGAWIEANENSVSVFTQLQGTTGQTVTRSTRISHQSQSLETSLFSTDAALFSFQRPVECSDFIGIDGSFTKLMAKTLFLTEEHYIVATNGGMKHSGNNYFIGTIASERFSSGFSGSGWSISQDAITGNHVATLDELVIRKKMRVYSMEIQKIEVTQGATWVSNSCIGDSVVKL